MSDRPMDNDYDTTLSENEKKVLHSLIRYPDLSDQSVHSKIGMKKSTFSSIKARLREREYYTKYYVPNFPKLGLELFETMFGNLNRFTTFEERMRVAGDMLKSFPEDFRIVSESNKAYNLSISQNYTEYAKNQEKFLQVYSENKFLTREGMHSIIFPFEISRFRAFMDYEPLIAKICDLEEEPYKDKLVFPTGKAKIVKLTKAERKVLVGLVKYSEASDTLIAENVGVSRNTVANAKKKFLKQQIAIPKIVPNLRKLGMKLIVFTYRRFNPKSTMKERAQASKMVKEVLSPHFYVSKNLEGVLISAHPNFEHYNAALDEIMRFYMRHDYILEEPVHLQMSLPSINTIKDFEFLDLVVKSLDFDDDD